VVLDVNGLPLPPFDSGNDGQTANSAANEQQENPALFTLFVEQMRRMFNGTEHVEPKLSPTAPLDVRASAQTGTRRARP